MGRVYTGFTERVRYKLYFPNEGTITTIEPEGWQTDDKEIARNEEYHGVYSSFSNTLTFYKDAADFITYIYNVYGINAEIRLTKEEMHPVTDLWTRSYEGILDMPTYAFEDKAVSIKFNSGGLEQILKVRESDDIEPERETTIDGDVLAPLVTNEVQLDGRRIFLQSKWDIDLLIEERKTVTLEGVSVLSDDPILEGIAIPFSVLERSHEEDSDATAQYIMVSPFGEVNAMFFFNSLEARTLRVYGNLKFDIVGGRFTQPPTFLFQVVLLRYLKENDGSYGLTEARVVFSAPHDSLLMGQSLDITFDETIQIGQGESLSFQYMFNGFNPSPQPPFIRIRHKECSLNVDEDSYFPPSKAKFLLIHDLASRLTDIITNQKYKFYSDYFGRTDLGYPVNGKGAFIGLTHGFWVRGFDKFPLSERYNKNPYKPMATSMRDLFDSMLTVCNVGVGIEKFGYVERIRMEELSHFYNANVTIKLKTPVDKVKRTIATKYYYSSIDIGYQKGGQYEEAMGLDEYNSKTTYTTIVKGVKGIFQRISPWRADSYGKEFARRKPKFRFGTTDTSYDNDNFILDLYKDVLGIFKERLWHTENDFVKEPEGVYDPESATNLRMSPLNLVLKHGWVIAAGLIKYPLDYIRYGSSLGNSSLKTQQTGRNEYAENDKILNSELDRARYVPEWLEFDHVVDFFVMEQIEGQTTLPNGKVINNKYGLVEFFNEELGTTEKGFLFSVKPNDGKWKLLKFNN